jgi:chaperone modulatory protein CbpM
MTAFALARVDRLSLDAFARAAGLHPELVRRLVALGLLEAAADAAGELWFPPTQLPAAARLQRLRAGFSLNWAALGLVCDLLDRIAALQSRGDRPWT